MKAITKRAKAVKISQIARSLPVEKWFPKRIFSKLTGISMGSCAVRLLVLTRNGHLERRGTPQLFEYKMSEKMLDMMIEQSVKDKTRCGPKKDASSSYIINKRKAESMAYQCKTELMLRAMKFI